MRYIQSILVLLISLVLISGCEFSDVEDFQGGISGTIFDTNNTVVPSDITSNTLVVKLLGEGDISPITIRVKGDGTFANTSIYPKNHKAWLEGPIISSDTVNVDLSKGIVEYDFRVIPNLTIINEQFGTATAESISLNYSIINNSELEISKREVYCSTIPFPTNNTGSGPYYKTVKVSLTGNDGQAEILGLEANTQYYVRIGASVNGNLMNYSYQLVVTTGN